MKQIKRNWNWSFNIQRYFDAADDRKIRSSRSQMFFKIGVLSTFPNFTKKDQCWNLFYIKLQAWKPATLLKRDSNTSVFLWNLSNFHKQFLLQITSGGCFWEMFMFWFNLAHINKILTDFYILHIPHLATGIKLLLSKNKQPYILETFPAIWQNMIVSLITPTETVSLIFDSCSCPGKKKINNNCYLEFTNATFTKVN